MPKRLSRLSLIELRCFIRLLDENASPKFVFYLLQECYFQLSLGTRWFDIGTTELDLKVLLNVCQHRQTLQEVQDILAKNHLVPLSEEDGYKLSALYDELKRYPAEYRGLPIAMSTLYIMIELAVCGYEHSSEIEAVA